MLHIATDLYRDESTDIFQMLKYKIEISSIKYTMFNMNQALQAIESVKTVSMPSFHSHLEV